MTEPDTTLAAGPMSQPIELAEEQRAPLRIARRWARFITQAAAVWSGLFLLLLLDLGVRNPGELDRWTRAQPIVMLAGVLCVAAGLPAAVLLFSYARNLGAFFVRGEPALARSFRRLRHFFVLCTCLAAITALLDFVAAWSSL